MIRSSRFSLLAPLLLCGSPLVAQTSSSRSGADDPSRKAPKAPTATAPAILGPLMSFMDVRFVNDNQGEVDAADIASGAVGNAALAANSVDGSKVADGSIGANDLGANSVGASEISAGAVGSSEVADNSLTASDLAADSVGASEIAAGAVGSSEVADNSLTAGDLAANSVGASEIAAGAVGSSEVADNSLTANDLASSSVGYSEIQFDCIRTELIDPAAQNWAFNVGGPYSNVDYRFELVEQDSFNHGLYIEYPVEHVSDFVLSCSKINGDHEFWVTADGDVFADGTFTGNQGIAQLIESSEDEREHEQGDVLAIDPSNPRSVHLARGARSTLVAGVFSEEAGMIASHRDFDRVVEADGPQGDLADAELSAPRFEVMSLGDVYELYREIPAATSGIMQVKVSAENGAILPGDLLVTARTPGHAMRDSNPAVGTVLGKALGSLASGTGLIEVLITLD